MATQPIQEKLLHQKNISKKRKFVNDGVFYSELNEFLTRVLGEDGYAGTEVRVTPIRTEIIVRATRTREVLGEKGRRIRELTSLVQKRFGFRENQVELFAEQIRNRGCCAMAQAESLRYKLLGGLPVRRACYGILNFVMKNGATGCEVIVSGKLRAQRAKTMKFRDGYLISTGDPKNYYIQESCRHVMMRQGVLGVKVKIMLGYDPTGERGIDRLMPDKIIVHDPVEPKIDLTVGVGAGAIMEEAGEVEEPVAAAPAVEQEAQAYAGGAADYGGESW
jgi:small subunit ribosomal protein S3e